MQQMQVQAQAQQQQGLQAAVGLQQQHHHAHTFSPAAAAAAAGAGAPPPQFAADPNQHLGEGFANPAAAAAAAGIGGEMWGMLAGLLTPPLGGQLLDPAGTNGTLADMIARWIASPNSPAALQQQQQGRQAEAQETGPGGLHSSHSRLMQGGGGVQMQGGAASGSAGEVGSAAVFFLEVVSYNGRDHATSCSLHKEIQRGEPVVTPTPRHPLCRRTIAGPYRQLRESSGPIIIICSRLHCLLLAACTAAGVNGGVHCVAPTWQAGVRSSGAVPALHFVWRG
jgi:hypothetical protein